MHGIDTLAKLNANNAEAARIVEEHKNDTPNAQLEKAIKEHAAAPKFDFGVFGYGTHAGFVALTGDAKAWAYIHLEQQQRGRIGPVTLIDFADAEAVAKSIQDFGLTISL